MKARALLTVTAVAAALAACGDSTTGLGDAGPPPPGEGGSTWSTLSPPTVYHCAAAYTTTLDDTVIDPQRPGSVVRVSVSVTDAGFDAPGWTHPLRVALVQGSSEIATLAEEADAAPGRTVVATWDGTIGGKPAPVGAYALRTTYGCSAAPAITRDATLAVVHAGTVEVSMGAGDGLYQPLLWHRFNDIAKNYWSPAPTAPVLVRGSGSGAVDLELADGGPSPFPAVWTGLDSPPVDASGNLVTTDLDLPFALSVTTHADVTLKLGLARPPSGATAAPKDPPVGDIPVRAHLVEAVPPGYAALSSDGASSTFRLASPLAPAVGRYDVTLHAAFEYQRPDGAWRPLGTDAIPLRVYGVLGKQTIDATGAVPYVPWITVVDAVAGWVDRTTKDPAKVAASIVHHVYNDLGLHYDTVSGACYYTTYGYGFGQAAFDLSAFLLRANGSTVNCSDCASIVSTYANMVGADLGYTIIESDFLLNYIKAIGTPAFTNDPFGTGSQGGFSYHAITSDPTLLVFDATLDENGTSNPGSPPFKDTEVLGLTRAFYVPHLTPSTVTLTYDDKTTIQ